MRCGYGLVIVQTFFVLTFLLQCILMDPRKETSIECAADVDITFKLYRNMLNKSLTIAECDFFTKSCFILTKTHEYKYKIVYTGRGGILIIRVLDETTIGTYQCFETFNPINIVSTNITLSEYRITADNYSDNSAETSVPVHIDTYGHIVIGTLKDTSIECSSNVDLTFRFFRNTSRTPATIGECDFTTKSCIILHKSLANKYNLYFTGRGEILQISRLDNETVGTYTCSETFNPLNFISVGISIPNIDSADNTTYGITTVSENTSVTYLDGSGTQDSPISWIMALCIMLTCALIISCIIRGLVLIKKKYPFRSASRVTIEREVLNTVKYNQLRNVNRCEEHDIRTKETDPILLDSETAHGVVKVFRQLRRIKLSDAEHQDCYAAIDQLLSDFPYLMQDDEKLTQLLEKDTLHITKEMFHLLEAVDEIFNNKLKDVSDTSVTELSESTKVCMKKIKEYLDACKIDIVNQADTHTRDVIEHADVHKYDIDEYNDSPIRNIGVQADKHTTRKDDHASKDSKLAENDYKRAREDLLQRLILHYNSTCIDVPLPLIDQSLCEPITNIYATPKIHRIHTEKNGTCVRREQVRNYKQIFFTYGNSNRRIYVQGEAGSGKSTFVAKLACDWAQDSQPPSEVPVNSTFFDDVLNIKLLKFIFLIAFSEVKGQQNLTQMIKTQLVDKMYTEEERDGVNDLILQILESELCLVVQDGLDEWVAPDGSYLAEPCFAGFTFEKCTVLTTTRPWKLTDECLHNSKIDILLEIEGVSEPYILSEMMLRCMIEENEKVARTMDEFKIFIRKQNLISISFSPMLNTIVMCTWVNKKEEENGLSLCDIFTALIENLFKKANTTKGYFNDSNPPPVKCFSCTSYLQPNVENLNKLSEAAFKLLLSTNREASLDSSEKPLSEIFSRDDFKVCKEFALMAGILTNRRGKSLTGSFIHKSVQAFLAAYYIACNRHLIDNIIAGYLKCHDDAFTDISQVFIFLCGIDVSAANILSFCLDELEESAYQDIILSGCIEAVASGHTNISLVLSEVLINGNNVSDWFSIWTGVATHVQSLRISVDVDSTSQRILSPRACKDPASCFKYFLQSCPKLKQVELDGVCLGLKDCDFFTTSDVPICDLLNRKMSTQCTDPFSLLKSLKHIELVKVTCSPAWLRSLFNTLLALGHKVKCTLHECIISPLCVEGAANIFFTDTNVTIMPGLSNTFKMHNIKSSVPGLWQALHDLNINSLSLKGERGLSARWGELNVIDVVSLCRSFASLSNLNSLSISEYDVNMEFWDALDGLKIKCFSLRGDGRNMTVKHASSLSLLLRSFTKLGKLSMHMQAYIDLLLPHSLNNLSLYYHRLAPFQLSDLVSKLSTYSKPVECSLEFGCSTCGLPENFFHIKQKLYALGHVNVKQFLIDDQA